SKHITRTPESCAASVGRFSVAYTRAVVMPSRVLRDIRVSDYCTGTFRDDNFTTKSGLIGPHAGLLTSACHPTSDIPRLELDFRC
ncbi:MAG: hypothetical protein ACE10G_02755, partial [Gemmatimonadales bacterium]